MRILVLTIFFLATGFQALAQKTEKIKIIFVVDGELVPGATFRVQDSNPTVETYSDENGVAILDLPLDKDLVKVTGLIEADIRLKIERPTDSIYFDLSSKKATFYNDKKKVKTTKQKVKWYNAKCNSLA
jgi:hypothetical protein